MKKLLVAGVIVLFISVSVIPSTGTRDVKQITVPTAKGDTLYVGGSGEGNYTKIQDAIDDASDGDTVFVYDDSSPYYETIVVDKSIQLIGEDRNTTVINGRKTYEEVVTLNAGDSTLSGFTITNSDTTKRGIYIYSDNNHISDCNVVDNRLGGIYFCNGGYDNNHISYCYFNPFSGIYFNGAGDELATGNVFSHCTFDGASIICFDAPETVVSDCEIYGPYSYIAFLRESDNCQVINCSIHSSNGIGITTECDGTVIKDCMITNFSEGIRIAYSPQETRIINCTITGCSGYAGIMFWGDSYKSIISGCNLTDNVYGIDVFGTLVETKIHDCNIANNEAGILIYFSNFFNRIYRNNFINNTKQIDTFPVGTYVWCMFNFYEENYWSDWKGIFPYYHVCRLLNWDFHPASEPYDIGV